MASEKRKENLAALPKERKNEKLLIEVRENSRTYRTFYPSLLNRRGEVKFVQVVCEDDQTRPMLDPGWAYINKVDKIARLDPQFKGRLDFVIWSQYKSQPACVLRSYGEYRLLELRQIVRVL